MKNCLLFSVVFLLNITMYAQQVASVSPLKKNQSTYGCARNIMKSVQRQEVNLSITNKENKVVCEGSKVELDASPGDFANYSFYHNGKLIQRSDSPQLKLDNVSAGMHVFQVYAGNNFGEIPSKQIELEVQAAEIPMISVAGSTTISPEESVVLIASFGKKYYWSNEEVAQSISVSEPGIYKVVVTDANGCSGTADPIQIKLKDSDGLAKTEQVEN